MENNILPIGDNSYKLSNHIITTKSTGGNTEILIAIQNIFLVNR